MSSFKLEIYYPFEKIIVSTWENNNWHHLCRKHVPYVTIKVFFMKKGDLHEVEPIKMKTIDQNQE